jgi:hypothetical protein
VLPYAAIATAYLYFDLRVAQHEESALAAEIPAGRSATRGGTAGAARKESRGRERKNVGSAKKERPHGSS